MKNAKKIAIIATSLVFMACAMGSGSSGGNTIQGSVTIAPSGTPNSQVGSQNSDSTNVEPATSKLTQLNYEITDTGFEYYTNSIGSVEYYGFVEITNTGDCDIFMKDCTFDIEDNDGHLLQTDKFIYKGPDVIEPEEKGYFYNGLGSNIIDSGVSFDNGVKLTPQITLKKATGKPHRFPVSDVSYRDGGYTGIKVTGRVENDTEKDHSLLSLLIIFRNAEGKVLAVDSSSITDTIAAGNKGSFESSTMFGNGNLKIEDIAEVEVICEEDYYQF